jgi:hypothetical protein
MSIERTYSWRPDMVSLPVLADVLFLCDRRCSCDCSINERVMLSASIACASVGVEIHDLCPSELRVN